MDGEDFAGLARWIAIAVPAETKEEHGAFTLAKLTGKRIASNVEYVTALGLDGDETGASARDVHERLRGFRRVVYSTHSNRPDAPRWRVILAFSRPATPAEFAKLVPLAHRNMADVGLPLDAAAVDPCRLWYVPAFKSPEHFECYADDGAPLDVDGGLAVAAELEAEAAAERAKRQVERQRFAPLRGRGGDKLARARAYVAKMPPAISGSGGHTATFNVARVLVQDFALADADALAVLDEYNARCSPPWTVADLERKVAQAHKARVANPIADRGAR